MPTPELREDSPFPLRDSFPLGAPQAPAGPRGLEDLRTEINASLDALIDGDFTQNDELVEREMRLCAELGRVARVYSATPEFRQAVGLLKILRTTARFREAQRDTSAA
jgi:hypothetical protein